MTRFYIVLCILALEFLANAQDLQTVVRGAPEDHERSDPQRGIHVSIERFADDSPNSSYSSHSSSTEIIDGIKYSVMVYTNDTSKKTFRIRLSEPTLRHLITDRDEHVYLRILAVRDLPDSGLDIKVKKALLSIAIKEPDASVRSAAARAIPSIKPQADVADLLVELLNDPCMDVVSWVTLPLVNHYDLRDESGEKLRVLHDEGFHKGSPSGFYFRHHQDALRVALALRAKDPELISAEAISAIRNRAIPSDEWFLSEGRAPTELAKLRKTFIQRYHQKAEPAGAGQPATRPVVKPEGGDKPQPEAEGRRP